MSGGGVLIRGVNWIGDAVMTAPALRALRRVTQGNISLLVKPWVAALFEKDPNINEIILYGHEGLLGKLRLSGELRKRNFSSAILLQNAFEAALVAFMAGIPDRAGYSRDGRGFLLTRKVPHKGEDREIHHIDYYLHLLKSLGYEIPDFTGPWGNCPWLYLDLEERLLARERLSALKRPVLGINPGAAYGSSKRWSPKKFSAVARRFVERTGGSIVIFGAKAEESTAREILDNVSPERALSLAGATTLRELISLISECDLLLTNDSGPMHVAYAVGTPLVAIFGSTSPALTGPPKRGSKVIKKGITCSPCFERECPGKGLKCMEDISEDEVFEALFGLLPKSGAVFFDRDGTLIKDAHYLNDWSGYEELPGLEALGELKARGFKLVGVTTQSGIGRGIVREEFALEVNDRIAKKFGFDAFYTCPHHPDDNCPCRKPSPAMPLTARLEHGIDLKRSYVVGDKEADMLLAKAVGAKGILVLTGQARGSGSADFVARGIKEAAAWIGRG